MILYYDCFSGISGDMNLAALIDLGMPVEHLRKELGKLKLRGYTLEVKTGQQSGIAGTSVRVRLDDGDPEKHHRNLEDITKIIAGSTLNDYVKEKSITMFEKLAEAEAKVHGKEIHAVHFHEVGAVDSIVDIVGAAICLDHLKPKKIFASAVELGSGFARCEHGTFPVPAPATAELLKDIPVKTGHQPFEATTPTGAVILACNVDEFTDNAHFTIHKTAYGLGHKKSDVPNVLRVFSVEEEHKNKLSQHSMIECNIDDMNPEIMEYIIDRLFEAGADDAFIVPVIMKKSRNASKLCVLFHESLKKDISEILIRETTTLGFRTYPVEKTELDRKFKRLETRYGSIRIKMGYFKGEQIKHKAEYDDCVKAAQQNNIPLKEVYSEVERSLKQQEGL